MVGKQSMRVGHVTVYDAEAQLDKTITRQPSSLNEAWECDIRESVHCCR